MNKTKIDWTDDSWNPVTGCLHNCPYCYAQGIAKRFGGHHVQGIEPKDSFGGHNVYDFDGIFDIAEPLKIKRNRTAKNPYASLMNAPFPYGFCPTFHRHRLDQPQHKKKPQNIFVGSMADLFGEWVPDEWIQEVFNACAAAPQHRYLFLTKNPERYWQVNSEDDEYKPIELYGTDEHPLEVYLGATVTNNEQFDKAHASRADWISIEPLLEELYTDTNFMTFDVFDSELPRWEWVVIGAETGDREDKIVPQREWIEAIVEECRHWGIPVLMKKNLADIWREPLIQEYPWDGEKKHE